MRPQPMIASPMPLLTRGIVFSGTDWLAHLGHARRHNPACGASRSQDAPFTKSDGEVVRDEGTRRQ